RPAGDPHAGPHARPRGPALPEQVPLHGRPPRLVDAPRPAGRLPRCQLVLVARDDPLDGTSARLRIRMGTARPRRLAPRPFPGDDAARARTLRRVDEGALTAGRPW